MKKMFAIMFLSSLFFWVRTQESEKIEVLDSISFKEAISNNEVQLVDVRTPREFKNGHIARSINIDFSQKNVFKMSFQKLDKDKPVYLYCRSGGRSQMAARKLVGMGFTKIYDLKGGFLAWK